MTRTPFNTGWGYREPPRPFAAAEGPAVTPTPVTLPHDALRDAERSPDVPGRGAGAYYPPGAYSYLKTFDVPAEWATKTVRLEFQGAYRHAMVFVNDEFAGNRADGYARFLVDIKPFLRLGDRNEVRVEVRSGQDSRWYSGCGLHRPVVLHLDDLVQIVPDGVRVTTRDVEADRAVIEVTTRVANHGLVSTTATLTTRISDPAGHPVEGDETPVTLAPGETALVRHRLYLLDPRLWSVDTPHLYAAASTLVAPSVTGPEHRSETLTTFGVRTVTADPAKGLRINGEPVLLRGACLHHDNGPLGAAAPGRAEVRRVELLKAAGFNAIRATHNPMSVAMLEACDRLGMLVMDEAFDSWTRGKTTHDYALDFPQWWADDLESLVAKDHNHPSVIMYSLGNEIVETGTPHGARLARRMAEHLRSLDPTRLVTNGVSAALAVLDEVPAMLSAAGASLGEVMADQAAATNLLSATESVTRRIAESSSVLDVLGLNYADSRYAMDRELFPHRVIVGSETYPPRIGTLWSLVREHDHVIGDFTWTGWDYLGEVGIGATAYAEDETAVAATEREYPFLTAWTGDLDITGWRRPVSYYREMVFGLRTEPYLAVRRPEHSGHTVVQQSPWAWSDSVSSWTWPGCEGRPVTVEAYADADEVALLLDDREVGRARVGEQLPMLAVLETRYEPGELAAVAYRDGAEVGRTSLATAGAPMLAVAADRTGLRADDDDLAYVTVELRDPEGRLVTGADRPVTVSVAGPAQLAGMCSANPKTVERFDADTWTTFDGRALAVVRPVGAGTVTVTAAAEGLEPQTLTLDVRS